MLMWVWIFPAIVNSNGSWTGTSQKSQRGVSVPRSVTNEVAAATMSPTSVVPPRTGGAASENPVRVVPLALSDALTMSTGCRVGTPTIENVPSKPVVPVRPRTPTFTPASGWRSRPTTRPTTVVSGSGMTLTRTVDSPTFEPRSTALAESVRLPAPTGAVMLNWYGAEVSVNTTAPSTRKLSDTTATSSVAVALNGMVSPSMNVAPSAGATSVTVGATPFRSSSARYCPM